jgi:large subunit ribosomal protein L5
MADTATYEPRLKARYREEIRAKMKEKFGYANDMQIPRPGKGRDQHGCGRGGSGFQEDQVCP